MDDLNILENVKYYADSGIKIFPVKLNSKGNINKEKNINNQLLKSWSREASSDINAVTSWWTKWPKANVCICGGSQLDGGKLIIIDVDTKKGKSGLESIEKYGENLPDTAKAVTPSGGYHLYYLVANDYKHANNRDLYPGIDIRYDGGYVVAPPSSINGKYYKWANNKPIAIADDAVYRFLDGPKGNKGQESLHIGEVIEDGCRDDTLFKLACSLQAKGLSDEAIIHAVWEENKTKCVPPYDFEYVKAKVESALKYQKGTSSYIEQPKAYNLDVTSMDEVEEKPAEWLIYGHVPKGQITMVTGDGGVGKTALWCNIAAAISNGKLCFFEDCAILDRTPQKVMFFSSEDDPRYTLKRRLRLNGANMANIITVPLSDDRFSDIKFNGPLLDQLIEKYKPALIIFDPLQSFIPPNVNMGYRNAMRDVLNPLIGLGEKYGTSFMIMSHTNKRENASGRSRMSDSSDIWDIARSVLIVGNTGDDNIRYMSHEKCNYGALQDTVLFTVDDGIPEFKGISKLKDCDYMSSKSYSRKGASSRDEAKDFILDYLKDGDKEANDLNEMAIAMSISKKTLERAKAELKKEGLIEIKRTGSPKSEGGQKTIISLSL